jgi:hypothetical protein
LSEDLVYIYLLMIEPILLVGVDASFPTTGSVALFTE